MKAALQRLGRMSTTSRILVGFLIFFAGALGLLLEPLLARVERQYLEAAEGPMVDAARVLAAVVEQQVQQDGQLDVTTIRAAMKSAHSRRFEALIYHVVKTDVNMNVYVTDAHGVVLFDSDGGHAEGESYLAKRDVALTLAGSYGARASRKDATDSMTSTLFVAAPIYHHGTIAGVLSVSKPQRSLLAFIQETRAQIRWLGFLFFLLVMLGAFLVTSVFSRPIRQLTQYTHAVTRGERPGPPPRGAPEITALGRAFEEMREALEDRKYVRTYVQTLTHEMKSPLAAIRGAAELLEEPAMPPEKREKFLANIQAEAQRLQQQIDRLLALSAIENRKQLESPEWIEVAELAQSVLDRIRPAAETRGVTLHLECCAKPALLGERFLIETSLDNLLQNAVDFSPEGGRIRVLVCVDHKWAQIEVEDDGTGIPDYALARIFDRFYSLQHPATGRKSSGLGLCFVREAVELHGGQAIVGNRQDGRGARAVLRLPMGRVG